MSPANVPSRAHARREPPGKAGAAPGLVAEQLVREWSPEMRQRVRALTLELGGDPALVELIDKVNEEEEVA